MTGWIMSVGRRAPGRLVPGRADEFSGALVAAAVAAMLALLAIGMGWRGSDLPAQLFRVELFRRDGFVLWNSQWFSGIPTLDYTVLSPVLAALTGPTVLCAASGAASAFLFHRLVHHTFGASARVGSVWFATSTVTNLIVGRVTFALGITFVLAALLALQRHRTALAVPCALLCALVSPVAGLFLAIAAGAWGIARPSARNAAWLVALAGIGPVVAIAMLFPSPGSQPYELWALGCDLGLCALVWFVVPARYGALRWPAAIYAVVLIATKVFASPLGGNVSRLNQYAAGPLLACALWEYRRALVVVVAIPLLFWQWFPTVDTILFARTDPSTHRAFYQPLLQFLGAQPHTFGRIEIPDTLRHWEAAFVAPQFALARGWERQLDYAYDAQFYDGTLTAGSFHTWLSENSVQYVALPDVQLDPSSTTEAKLLNGRLPYL
ncbi:MAG TPA: hypothetical protein VK771_05845, partial [Acidimicrobiia bacterium]|nr:hypothetical protein [Acidimicrobiia bacterium]